MAKATKKAADIADEEVITVEAIEIVPAETETKALALVDPFEAKLNELREQYGNVEIKDKASLELAKVGIKTMTALRNQVKKRQVEIFRPVDNLRSKVIEKVDKFVLDVKAIEQPIRDQINAEELRQQEAARQEHLRRINLLTGSGWTLVGQFYVCGPHRVQFDLVDTAENEQLDAWVKQGNEWVESERQRLAKEAEQRRADEAAAEARRAEQAEWEEFQRWKAAQAAAAAPAPAPVAPVEPNSAIIPAPTFQVGETVYTADPIRLVENHAPVVPVEVPAPAPVAPVQQGLWGNEPAAPEAPVETTAPEQPEFAHQFATAPAPSIETEEQLAVFRNSSISFLRTTPEARVYYNQAIDDVLRRFGAESHTKAEWTEIFKMMKR